MDQPEKDKKQEKPCLAGRQARILVTPLNWGLGHATRCIPVIRELLAQGCEVIIGSSGASVLLLKNEFPQLHHIEAPAYTISYSRRKWFFPFKLMLQYPKLKKQVKIENKWLQEVVDRYSIDAVISDNRFGMYHRKVLSVIITHQLAIKTGLGALANYFAQKKNYAYIRNFSACWIPDYPDKPGLAGTLSHPQNQLSIPFSYTGPLTRFIHKETAEIKNHLLIILSGPEPQRTILENKILSDIHRYNGTAAIVRGLPGSASLIPSSNSIQVYNHLSAEELNKEMLKAEYIISRTGYSTIMDIAALGKKSILIPTPGQSEQEYLGKLCTEQQTALVISQNKFSFLKAVAEAGHYHYKPMQSANKDLLKQTIQYFLLSLP